LRRAKDLPAPPTGDDRKNGMKMVNEEKMSGEDRTSSKLPESVPIELA